jgi:hypothetical protein
MSDAARLRLIGIVLGSLIAAGEFAAAEDAPSADQLAFFEQSIRPVLVKHCYECHSSQIKSPKGGLLLDSKAGWTRGGESGEPAIVPGKPDVSPLIRFVRHEEPGMEMPPEKPRLSDAVIADLIRWVELGAPDPRTATAAAVRRADKSWWSLQPLASVKPPEIPTAPADWQSNSIDQFVFAKLHEAGLSPSARADRRTLIRRLTYDLIGLPPSPEEVRDFVNDDAPNAYEKLVDRLLVSPHYGERWGRHWLDVVRFGESRGFERNEIINDAWPFRDYVIRSFNADKPFNQFIIEHLAGDVVAKETPDEVGVAFLTIGPYDDVGNQDAVAAANIRAATIDDMVTATGSAFLGLTINCAKCHHHKFDPIPTEDYYRIKCAFEGVSHGSRPMATTTERQQREAVLSPLQQKRAALVEEQQKIESAIVARADAAGGTAKLRSAPSAQLTEEAFEPVTATHVRLSILATTDNPVGGVNARIDEFEIWTAEAEPRNVALDSAGGKAIGASARMAADFKDAYGVELVNDGKFSQRWFAGSPPVLTISLAKPESISRVTFSHDRIAQSELPVTGTGPAVAEYEIHVSPDGETWTKVADSFDRQPRNEALARRRKLHQFSMPEEIERMAASGREIGELDGKIAAIPPLPTAWMGQFNSPPATAVFRGGDPQQPGDVVAPASLQVLSEVTEPYSLATDSLENERRLALAKWIVSDGNPLTARVLVNRLWHYHFGTGIVDTPGDFGFLGGKPSHAELLDWLAARLHQHGWRLKPLHRELVLSQTYRQASAFRPDAAAIDRDSRLLWRFPPQRLDAEEVRDTLLAVAGKLDLRAGGPGYRLYEYQSDNVSTYVPLESAGPETYRRAVYHQNARASVIDILSDFDLPDTAFAAPRRGATTTPLQALTMLNHGFAIDMANALAERVQDEPDDAARVRRVYELSYQRQPAADELALAVEAVEKHGLRTFCRAVFNSNELLFVD